MTFKSASSIPHDHRLISRQEAAKLLGCTTQTIANWIEKGAIKGHTIDKYVFVDRQAIESLFDTAADVARMEETLKERKKELKAELKNHDEAVIDLRNEKSLNVQGKALRALIDNSVLMAKDTLHDYEAIVVAGALQGKTLTEIAGELKLTGERVRQILAKAMPKLLSKLDYSEWREENNTLRKKSEELQKEVDYLRQMVSELGVCRKIEGTPLALDISKFGFSVRLVNILHKLGCNNLADLLKLDFSSLTHYHKLSRGTMQKIEQVLESIGLRLGMNLNSMSDDDFNNLVAMLANLTGYTTIEFNTDVEPLKAETGDKEKESFKVRKAIEKGLNKDIVSLEAKLAKKDELLESQKKTIIEACDVISNQKETIRIQQEEIKSLRKKGERLIKLDGKLKRVEAELKDIKDKRHSRKQNEIALFEHKEATLKTWIKGLEDDLASKREHIKSLEIAQKELQEENAKLKAQVEGGLYAEAGNDKL